MEDLEELVEHGRVGVEDPTSKRENSSRVTIILVIIQIALYLASCLVGGALVNPARLTLLEWGLVQKQYIACALCGYVLELRRLLLPTFLHLGPFHLASNAVFQLLVGPTVEKSLGSRKFLIVFLTAGLFGNLLAAAASETSAGASTACYGLLGVGIAQTWLSWPDMDAATQLAAQDRLKREGLWLLVWEILGWNSLAHFGHLGGLIAGMCLTVTFSDSVTDRSVKMQRNAKVIMLVTGLACTLIIFVPVLRNFSTARSNCASLMYIYN